MPWNHVNHLCLSYILGIFYYFFQPFSCMVLWYYHYLHHWSKIDKHGMKKKQTPAEFQEFLNLLLKLLIYLKIHYLIQKLNFRVKSLIETIYVSIPWDGDYQLGKDMLLMMIRSQRVFHLKSQSIIMINHVLLAAVRTVAREL